MPLARGFGGAKAKAPKNVSKKPKRDKDIRKPSASGGKFRW